VWGWIHLAQDRGHGQVAIKRWEISCVAEGQEGSAPYMLGSTTSRALTVPGEDRAWW
jgi:hypothetical protein